MWRNSYFSTCPAYLSSHEFDLLPSEINNVYNIWFLSHFMQFCYILFVFCHLRCFVAKSVLSRFTRFCVEKNLAKIFVCREKNGKYQVCTLQSLESPQSPHSLQSPQTPQVLLAHLRIDFQAFFLFIFLLFSF